ncbi:MAG TPA: hypothetical protein H9876_04775 [Candidatus Limosilactobacillus merdipullorum]|uniref:Uncharacterized protein n=1 Tax=Candidatus Limosilactobacillus merdipullorum TaxID=2838653 RepID=A0A9D1QPR5_9LACO|nr:hypothetical protein [Candidatus Limosilactobacillus merdipullorum]
MAVVGTAKFAGLKRRGDFPALTGLERGGHCLKSSHGDLSSNQVFA